MGAAVQSQLRVRPGNGSKRSNCRCSPAKQEERLPPLWLEGLVDHSRRCRSVADIHNAVRIALGSRPPLQPAHRQEDGTCATRVVFEHTHSPEPPHALTSAAGRPLADTTQISMMPWKRVRTNSLQGVREGGRQVRGGWRRAEGCPRGGQDGPSIPSHREELTGRQT